MNDPILLRRLLREALAMRPNRHFVESLLFKNVQMLATELKVAEFQAALNWNKSQGYIASQRNRDYDEDEWFLTAEGKQKEGL